MEKKMENEMESGVMKRLFRDPSIQIIPTLGPKVCKYYLHWAIWIPRVASGVFLPITPTTYVFFWVMLSRRV